MSAPSPQEKIRFAARMAAGSAGEKAKAHLGRVTQATVSRAVDKVVGGIADTVDSFLQGDRAKEFIGNFAKGVEKVKADARNIASAFGKIR